MATRMFFVILILLGAWSSAATASVLVLVHGYLGDAESWSRSGVEAELQSAGWQRAGVWYAAPGGPQLATAKGTESNAQIYYPVALPSQAPLMIQADALQAILNGIRKRHPEQDIELVGHSAGGVVARLVLVRHGAGQVSQLITIGSPHLGTPRAWQALQATDDSGLFGGIKRWFVKRKIGDQAYQTVQQSRGALADLAPPAPGNLLFWLNSQQHPDITYVSILRTPGQYSRGDMVVPAYSQDMNQIPTLRGKSQRLTAAQGHLLGPADGRLLVKLLSQSISVSAAR